jgi:threonine synthase
MKALLPYSLLGLKRNAQPTYAFPLGMGLRCDRCDASYPLDLLIEGCPTCLSEGLVNVLEVETSRSPAPPAASSGVGGAIARYAPVMPLGTGQPVVTLGEGATPLVRSKALARTLGLKQLYLKNEAANPTWSFKDRYVAVTISLAQNFGVERIVVSSTGNLGVSAAAFAAAAGMTCLVLMADETSSILRRQARAYGAHLALATPEHRPAVFEHLARAHGWFPIGLFLPRRINNPFGIEGYKTIAYEIARDLGAAPGAVLFPCARGNGLYGAWKGFRDARAWGWVDAMPRMIACQPQGANSLEVSFAQGVSEPVTLPPARSVAASTAEQVADRRALEAIRQSGGAAFSASEDEIRAAQESLAREGLYVEASSALVVACLPRLTASNLVDPAAPVVCLLTAAGVKWDADAGADRDEAVPHLGFDPALIERFLAGRGLA